MSKRKLSGEICDLIEEPNSLYSDFDDDELLSETSQIFIENPIPGAENYFSGSEDELLSEAAQIFIENPLYGLDLTDSEDELPHETSRVHVENHFSGHNQSGCGFENRPGPSTAPDIYDTFMDHNLDNAIVLEEVSRRQNQKYNAEELTMRVRMDFDLMPDNLKDTPLYFAAESLRRMFEIIIKRSTRGLRQSDLIRIIIQSDGLDRPISTCIMRVSQLSVERVLSCVLRVLQSKQEIELDAGFLVDVITIRQDAGAGPFRKVTNISVDRLRKQSILSIPTDEEGLCCAKAIVYGLAHLERDQRAINAMRDRRRPALMNRARKLHIDAGVPIGACTYAEIAKFESFLDVQIVVISSENLNKVSYKGQERSRRITLWLHDNHYDVVKSLKGFYGRKHYCQACEKGYQRIEDHHCTNACYICHEKTCILDQPVRCSDCDRLCRSRDCFNRHKQTDGNQQLSFCERVYQCRICSKKIKRRDCPKEQHCCHFTRCPSCTQMVNAEEHKCCLKLVSPKKPSLNFIFFDFETDQSSGEHVVNFAVAQYADGEEKVFSGYDACDQFCSWLFTDKHAGYTAIAHNMKGFDGQFVVAWLLRQGTAPEIIPNGSKLMAIKLKPLNIRVIDSYNFMPMALSKLPACFGLSELKKGYFPHFFNSTDNQNYIGPLPEQQFYGPEMMSACARKSFLEWYEEHKLDNFDFQEEMKSYCSSDVHILRRCCLDFRSQFLEITKVDPFCYITIAAACMAVYRSNYIQPNTIGMVPVYGYVNRMNYSADAIRWLDFVSKTDDVFIQHALNGLGEKKICGISVDGFHEDSNTIYQYHGCFFHGCIRCYDRDSINPLKGVTMFSLYEKTLERTNKFRALGYNVVEKWEHEFVKEKIENLSLKEFTLLHEIQDRLSPRDAFFGGRTNAVKLYYEGTAKYVDFTSLYPWVNKYCKYPVGHPDIITQNFSSLDEYFGIIKCRVLAPSKLYLPVLPVRVNGKLMFPLCSTCATNMQQTHCEHSNAERSIVGTWVTEEVKLAVSKGYTVLKIYEVYNFEASSDTLFKSFIDGFLKIKQESSGWPTNCETLEEKANYIKAYKEHEGIELEMSGISKNPGRRQVAKLALNSFWGRFGMNCNKGQIQYVDSVADFNKILMDPTKKIKDVYLPTPEIAAIHWERKKEFINQDTSTNIFIAAFTTSWARIKLYTEMDKLGEKVLYHDTDSIIYASDGMNEPQLGNYLGDFTDELDGETITSFVSGGAKNYAYVTNTEKTCCKIRGFTMNFKNSQKLNFNVMKSLVFSMDNKTTISIENPTKIVRDAKKKRKVLNKYQKKLYKIVYDKRIIQQDLSTLPYGYQ